MGAVADVCGERGAATRTGEITLASIALLAVLSVPFVWGGEASPVIVTASDPTPASANLVVSEAVAPSRAAVPGTPDVTNPLPQGESESQPDRPAPAEVFAWIEALRDDDIGENAMRASQYLREADDSVVAPLEVALHSADVQQRMLAASALRWHGAAPTKALIEVSLEGLRRDLPFYVRRVDESVGFLWDHARIAEPRLRWALASDDAQQRFYAAFVLAEAGLDGPIVRRILVDHLADNNIRGDAGAAAHALFRLGRAVLPTIRAAMSYADRQARELLALIELDLLDPPRDASELFARRALQSVTKTCSDPILEWRRSWMYLPRW